MINDLKNEALILEIQELIAGIDSAKNEFDIYCDLIKQMVLSGSGLN